MYLEDRSLKAPPLPVSSLELTIVLIVQLARKTVRWGGELGFCLKHVCFFDISITHNTLRSDRLMFSSLKDPAVVFEMTPGPRPGKAGDIWKVWALYLLLAE